MNARRSSRWFVARCYAAAMIGSGVGGTLRWQISGILQPADDPGFFLGTWAVNIVGSFIIGLYAAFAVAEATWRPGPVQRHLVMTGFCGGFTTFSIFSLETLQFLLAGRTAAAVNFTLLSTLAWLAAVWLGYGLGSRLRRHLSG